MNLLNLQYQNLVDLSISIALFVTIFVFLILFEPRCSRRVYLATLIPFLVLWIGGNVYILAVYGLVVLGRYILLTGTLPSLIYFFIVAKNRGGRFFFTFCLCDTVIMWILMVTGLIDHAVGGEGLVNFILRMLFFPLIVWVAWQFARKPYLTLLNTVSHGWWLFAVMTGLFYLTLAIMAAIPTNLHLRPDDMPAAVMVLVLLPLTYVTIFIVIYQQDELFRVRERQHTFAVQSAMMEQRIKELCDAENRFRSERHNLRHRLVAISGMLQQNDTKAALDYIGASQQALDATMVEHYCSDPALDAILSSYFRQAKELGIQLETHIDLPAGLPVSTAELSIVFANALENAIQAVTKLPSDQRRIVFKSVTRPMLIVEISNPFAGEITFDRNGVPIANRPGHGLGTRSIVAFAEKHDALCLFRVENGWFKLQLAVHSHHA